MFLKISKIIFACILMVIAHAICMSQAHIGGNIANKYFLEKEKFLFEILHRIEDPLMNREWLGIGKNLILNESNYLNFKAEMRDFLAIYRNGSLLSADQIYNPFETEHYRQTLGLFYFLYNTNDWETLRTNACWARKHVNPGMFHFALIQALLKRIDLKGLLLPKIHEIVPHFFHSENVIRIVENFDYSQWSRSLDFFHGNSDSILRSRRRRGIQSNWKAERLPARMENVRGTPKWAQAMEDVTALWFPATPPLQSITTDNALSYFVQDVDWNTFWYSQNMGLWWYDDIEAPATNEDFSLWEMWFGNLQQILARYKLEAYAVGYQQPTVDTTSPQHLTHWHGAKFRVAKNHAKIHEKLSDLIAQVERIISEQRLETTGDGRVLQLLHGRNWYTLLREIFGRNLFEFFQKFFALPSKSTSTPPQLLQYFETQLRDVSFYYYAERLLKVYQRLRENFQSYEISQLKQANIKFLNISISRLESFTEAVDFDVTNALSNKHFYFEGQLLWEKSMLVRQQRLQHRPYTIQLNITSAIPQAIVLRIFLAPVAASSLLPDSYFQLDSFVVNLIAGTNSVQRESSEFFGAKSSDHLSYTELYRYVLLALDDQYDFPLNISTTSSAGNCAFPMHLTLPRGGLYGQGLPVKFFFIATPYAYRFREAGNLDCDFTDGITRFDELPLNFPFDYAHDEVGALLGDNVHWKRAEIYHLS